jgi:hypothetical protein
MKVDFFVEQSLSQNGLAANLQAGYKIFDL